MNYKNLKLVSQAFMNTLELETKVYKVTYYHYEHDLADLTDNETIKDLLTYFSYLNNVEYTDLYTDMCVKSKSRVIMKEYFNTLDYLTKNKIDVAKVKQIHSLIKKVCDYKEIDHVHFKTHEIYVDAKADLKVVKEVQDKLKEIK